MSSGLWMASQHVTHAGRPFRLREGGPWHEWFKNMYYRARHIIVGATQIGKTEVQSVLGLGVIPHSGGASIWCTPTRKTTDRLYQARIFPVIDRNNKRACPLYVRSVLRKSSDSIEFKTRHGRRLLHLIGSEGAAGKENPAASSTVADALLIDEYMICHEGTLGLLWNRLDGSQSTWFSALANPRVAGDPTAELYYSGSQSAFRVRTDCGHWIEPDWERHYINPETRKPRFHDWAEFSDFPGVCHKCGKPFHAKELSGEWAHNYPSRAIKTFQVSQLDEGPKTTGQIYQEYLDAVGDDERYSIFVNNKLGKFTRVGIGGISEDQLERCVDQSYYVAEYTSSPTYLGVDPNGNNLVYVVLDIRSVAGRPHYNLVEWGVRRNGLDGIQEVIDRRHPVGICFDNGPETHLVTEAKRRWPNCWSALYSQRDPGSSPRLDKIDRKIHTNRTQALDSLYSEIRDRRVTMAPAHRTISDVAEWQPFRQLLAPQKYLETKTKSEGEYLYSKGTATNRQDFPHGWVYAKLSSLTAAA